MLRHLYKTLIISIMCGSLIIMDMTAFAQTSSGMTSATPSTPVTRDANGVYSKTDTHKMSGTDNGDSALNVVMMLAVGIIGTKLLTYKKWTTDMTIVAVASAAYIAAEIVNIMNLKKQLKDMDVQVTKYSNGKKDQAQIETIQKLRESYEAVKQSTKTRKMLQMGAAAIYGAATVMAGILRFTEEGKLASCMTAVTNAEAVLTACAARPTTDPEQAGCALALPTVTPLIAEIPKIKLDAEFVGPPSPTKEAAILPQEAAAHAKIMVPGTTTIAASQKLNIQQACETYFAQRKMNSAYGVIFASARNEQSPFNLENILYANNPHFIQAKEDNQGFRKYFASLLNQFIPSAEAGYASLLGLGVGAAVALTTTQTSFGMTIDKYMYTPGGRIIAWGIMTGAALLGAQQSQKEIDKIDDNLKKIDRILADLNALEKGIKTNNVAEQQIKFATFNPNNSSDLQLSSNPAVKTDCLLSTSAGACASLSNQLKEMPGFANLPDSFKSIASQSAKIGDSLSGANSISGSTMSSISDMANKQKAISKAAANTKTKLNDLLTKNGQSPVNYEKEEKKLSGMLKDAAVKALQSKGYTASSLLASAGLSSLAEANKSALASMNSDSKKSLAGIGVVPLAAGSKKEKDFDLSFREEGIVDAGIPVAGPGADGAQEEKYDIGQNDINTNSNESIFEMISNRYIKSGYPKLLEEEAIKK